MKAKIFVSALLVGQLSFAATPIDGLYGSVSGGYTYLPDNLSITQNGLYRNDAEYKSGYNAGASFGYQSNPLRYEIQLTYFHADLDQFRINGARQNNVDGFNQAVTAMGNVYYQFPDLIEPIQPFIGIGLGYAWVEGQFNANGPILVTNYKGSNSVFAYQASGGLTYNFRENWALNFLYRYLATEKIDDLGKVFQTHNANLELVYRFDGCNYK
tara:strand:- start:606 stop:1244 length:639 start_codon:yes stop_codon:yes gene_type:complete